MTFLDLSVLINKYIYVLETSGIMSRLFGYTAAAADRDTAAIEAFENKKVEAKTNYRFVNSRVILSIQLFKCSCF